jgi:hypothetical protein
MGGQDEKGGNLLVVGHSLGRCGLHKYITPDMVQSWLSEMQARLVSPEAPAQIEALDKEIVRLKRAIDRLLDMIETGDNGREVPERLRQRQAELGSAEMERDALAQHHLVTTIKLGDADLAAC